MGMPDKNPVAMTCRYDEMEKVFLMSTKAVCEQLKYCVAELVDIAPYHADLSFHYYKATDCSEFISEDHDQATLEQCGIKEGAIITVGRRHPIPCRFDKLSRNQLSFLIQNKKNAVPNLPKSALDAFAEGKSQVEEDDKEFKEALKLSMEDQVLFLFSPNNRILFRNRNLRYRFTKKKLKKSKVRIIFNNDLINSGSAE